MISLCYPHHLGALVAGLPEQLLEDSKSTLPESLSARWLAFSASPASGLYQAVSGRSGRSSFVSGACLSSSVRSVSLSSVTNFSTSDGGDWTSEHWLRSWQKASLSIPFMFLYFTSNFCSLGFDTFVVTVTSKWSESWRSSTPVELMRSAGDSLVITQSRIWSCRCAGWRSSRVQEFWQLLGVTYLLFVKMEVKIPKYKIVLVCCRDLWHKYRKFLLKVMLVSLFFFDRGGGYKQMDHPVCLHGWWWNCLFTWLMVKLMYCCYRRFVRCRLVRMSVNTTRFFFPDEAVCIT